jgi:CelD/BcsL family acetyltransferase involved in cellulose biosynthesis
VTAASRTDVVRGAAVLGRLASGTAAPTPFQTAGWYRAWIREAAGSEGATPLLVTAGLPGGRRVRVGLQVHVTESGPVLRPLSWPWADYHCASPDTGHKAGEADQALAGAIDKVQRAEGARLDLPDVAADGTLHRAAIRLGARIRPGSPVVSIDLADSRRVSAIVNRGEIALKRRRLARLGQVTLTHQHEPTGRLALMPSFIAMHGAQWQAREDAVAPFDGGAVDRTFTALAAAPDTGVVLSELRLDSTPLAMYFGFVHRSRYWAYRTAFDQAYRRLSPGHLLLAGMITDFSSAGIRAFDLMRGDYAYKLNYASRVSANIHAQRDCP